MAALENEKKDLQQQIKKFEEELLVKHGHDMSEMVLLRADIEVRKLHVPLLCHFNMFWLS